MILIFDLLLASGPSRLSLVAIRDLTLGSIALKINATDILVRGAFLTVQASSTPLRPPSSKPTGP